MLDSIGKQRLRHRAGRDTIGAMDVMNPQAIERATLAAVCPATLEEIPGWLLALDQGTVGRAHSAVPLLHGAPDIAALAAIELRYRAHGLSPVFRLPVLANFERFRAALRQRGYAPAQPTQVLVGTASAMLGQFSGAGVTLAAAPDAAWASVFLGEGFDPQDGASRVRLLGQAKDAVFASVRLEGAVVAAGVGCFSHGWASVHGMRTALAHRGQGRAGSILGALAAQAQARRIDPVFLQVDAANGPARSLYRRAGFTTAWTYEYWRLARAGQAA
ncbi:MAG: acetyltransferase family protein [Polaromonas sp.]|nr:acetyltransferase family protein [Polaromonas sp.]